ncbi:MAG: hypothetical protein R3E68_10375 [Burkholderiaceae bacterium]
MKHRETKHPKRADGLPARRLASLAISAALSLAPGLVSAQEAADREISAAAYDLDRIAKELPGLTPSRRANITRLGRSLKAAEQRLMNSPNQAHPSWIAQKQRVDDFKARLSALQNPAPAPAPAAAPAAAPKAGATTTARDTSAPAPAPAAAATPSPPAGLPAVYQRKLRNLTTDYERTLAALDALDPKQLHGRNARISWQTTMKRLQSNLKPMEPVANDPDVAAMLTVVPELVERYAATEAKALADYEALGDVVGQVVALRQRYSSDRLPKPLDPPYDAERAEAWVNHLRSFAAMAIKDETWLKEVRSRTNEHDLETRNALNGTIGGTAQQALTQAIERTREKIYEPIRALPNSQLANVAGFDPSDKHLLRNNLLGEGQYEKLQATLREARAALAQGEVINKALGKPQPPEAATAKVRLDDYEARIDKLYTSMLAEIRMPKPRSTDPKLLAVAAEALSQEKYGYKWERMVINSDFTSRKESRAWWSGGVATIADYDWDEFQVATAEKVGDKTFIFYNKLHFYRSGSSKTPLNRWIINQRFQSSQILPENIGE